MVVVLLRRDDSVELKGMLEDVLIFVESPSLANLVEQVKGRLGWTEGDVALCLKGFIDVGSSKGPRIKRLLKITSEVDWGAYKAVVLSAEVRSLDVVVYKDYGNGRDTVEACTSNQVGIEIGHSLEEDRVLTQPTYDEGGGDEDEFDNGGGYPYDGFDVGDGDDYGDRGGYRDDNPMSDDDASYGVHEEEVDLDDGSGDDAIDDDISDEDDLSGEEDFGDARASNRLDVEVVGDDDIYEDEVVVDSDDDRPVRCLSARKIEILRRVLPDRDPTVPDFEDLSHDDRTIADRGPSDTSVPDVSSCTIIWKGILFATMDDVKTWLQEFWHTVACTKHY